MANSHNKIDLTGMKFGRLTVIKEGKHILNAGNCKYSARYWLCKCDCGNLKEVAQGNLKDGSVASCGCIKTENLISKKFNRLTVIDRAETKSHRTNWLCKCECGNTVIRSTRSLKGSSFSSCGCYNKEFLVKARKKDVYLTLGMGKTRFYKIWYGMKERCFNSDATGYEFYGQKGIKVCNDWLLFKNFHRDMYLNYIKHCEEYGIKNTTIDRIDSSKDYSKNNCRWETLFTQANNRSSVKKINIDGEILNLKQIGEKYNIATSTIQNRLKRGMSIEEAISQPIKKRRKN